MESRVKNLENVNTRMFIGGIPIDITESIYIINPLLDEVEEYFSHFGPVKHIHLPRREGNSNCKGFGFVSFATRESLLAALSTSHKLKSRKVIFYI